MRENEEIDFVFIDDAKRPYRVMMYCGTPWLFYWHPDNKWVTLREVTQSEIWDFGQNKLDPEQASLYELTSNPSHQGTTHLVRRTLDGVVLPPDSENQSERK